MELPAFNEITESEEWANINPDERRNVFQAYKRQLGKESAWKKLSGDEKFNVVRSMESFAGMFEEPPKPPGLIGKTAMGISEKIEEAVSAIPGITKGLTPLEGITDESQLDYEPMGIAGVGKPAIPLPARQGEPLMREKGLGYLGELKRPDGGISTELSIGVNMDGQEIEIPSLVPTLTKDEINHLLAGNQVTKQIVNKAVVHARKRMAESKSPFAQKGEAEPELDTWEKVARPFKAQAYKFSEAVNKGLGSFSQNLHELSEYVGNKLGMKPSGAFEKGTQFYMENAEYWNEKAQEVNPTFVDEMIGEAVGGAVPGIAEFMLNVPYFAITGAKDAAKRGDNEAYGALIEGAERYTLGKIFHALGILKKPLAVPGMGGIFATQAALKGASPEEIAKSFGAGALYGVVGKGGKVGLKEAIKGAITKKEPVVPEVEPAVEIKPIVEFKGYMGGEAGIEPVAIYNVGKDTWTAKTLKEKDIDVPKTPTFEEWSKKPPSKAKIAPTVEEKVKEVPEVKVIPEIKPEPTLKAGYVWIKNKQKPFTEYREIIKGKDKGKFEATLADGKKVRVEKGAVRVWPEKAKIAVPEISKQKEIKRQKMKAVPSVLEIKPIESEVARSQIIKNIEEKLELPIRTGRFRQKALGIYKEKERIIRLKRPNDIEVAIHETAHDIQRLMGIKSIPPEVQALAYEGAKNVSKEGFAEFVRYYVTDQAKAKKKALIFYKEFEQSLKEYPDIQGVLVQTRQAWEAWVALPSVDKVGSFIKEGSDRKKLPTMNELYTWGVDEFRPLQVLSNKVKEKGIPLKITEDPFLLAWFTRGWARKAEQYLRWGTFQLKEKGVEFRSDSLKDILAPIEKSGERQMLDRYLVAKRAINDPRILKGFKDILSKEDFAQTVKELEPRFKDIAKRLYEYSDNLVEYLVDSGRISQDLANTIKEKNLFYTPLYRVMDGDTSLQGLSRKKYGNLFNPIKKLKGSSRDIHSPTESLMYNTFAMINVAERNRVGEALVKISELEGMGVFIEQLPVPLKPMKMTTKEALTEMAKSQGIDPKGFIMELGLSGVKNKPILDKVITAFRANYNPQKGEVIFYKRGEPQIFVLDPDLHKAVMAMDAESLGTIVKLAGYPAKWLRAGATLSPEFVIRNPARDQLTAFLYSKYNFVPAYDLLRGVFHILGKTEVYQKFNSSGAAHAAVVSLDRDYLSKNLKEILASKIRQIPHVIKNPLETMQILSELTEEATRVGEFAKGLRKGEGLEGLLKAGLAARDITLDFQRIGLKTKGMNAITAFWNAQIQGVDKMVRSFKDNPGRTSLKVFAGITLPSILLWYAQKDDPYYQEIPNWRRILFWNIVTHNEDGSLKRIWSIPKPFEPGILFGSLPEMALDWIYTQNPEGFKETLKSLLESTSPGFIPTLFVPIVEWIANRQLFFDRPVVPRSKEDLEPRLQYGLYASETLKLVAEGMSKVPILKEYASPAKIQTLIRGYTAGVGRVALEGIDALIKRLGVIDIPPDPAMTLSDVPGIRAFTARFPTANTRSIEIFYKQYIKRKQKWESTKEIIGLRGKGAEITRELAKYKPPELVLDEIVAKALSAKRKITEIIYKNEKLNPDEKLKLLNANYWDMINIARTRLGKEPIPLAIPLPSKKEIKPAIPLVGMGKK